jgi:hypothetical protein
MQNTQELTPDLIVDNEALPQHNNPYLFGVIAISALLISALLVFTILPSFGLILFLGSFVVSIIGLFAAKNYKQKYSTLTDEQSKKLKLGKTLSLITLILSSIAIVTIVVFFIWLANVGFSR